MPKTRRELLRSAWKIGAAMLGAAATWTTFEALRPLASGSAGARIRVGDAGNFAAGTATYVPEGRMYVVNVDSQIFALSQKCPHLGCRVPFCESSGKFECPCHASVFNLAGEWQTGPSPRGLDRFTVSLDGTELIVDTAELADGPDRGSEQFDVPATGPDCPK